jgi:hypothetical protein
MMHTTNLLTTVVVLLHTLIAPFAFALEESHPDVAPFPEEGAVSETSTEPNIQPPDELLTPPLEDSFTEPIETPTTGYVGV